MLHHWHRRSMIYIHTNFNEGVLSGVRCIRKVVSAAQQYHCEYQSNGLCTSYKPVGLDNLIGAKLTTQILLQTMQGKAFSDRQKLKEGRALNGQLS